MIQLGKHWKQGICALFCALAVGCVERQVVVVTKGACGTPPPAPPAFAVPDRFSARYPVGDQPRTEAQVQHVFDQNQGYFTQLYQQERAAHPCAQGTIVVAMAISGDGHVAGAEILYTDLSPEFSENLRHLVSTLYFGVAEGSGYYNYPHRMSFYLPANAG